MTSVISIVRQQGIVRSILQDKLLKNAVFLFLITVVNSIGGFAFWTLAARSIPPDQVGVASSTISAVILVSTLAGFGLGFGFIRFLNESEAPMQLFKTLVWITSLASVLAGIIFLFLTPVVTPGLSQYFSGLWLESNIIVLVVTIAISNLLLNFFTAYRATSFAFIQILLFNLIRIAPLFTSIRIDGPGLVIFTNLAFLLSNTVSFLFFVPKFYKEAHRGDRANSGLLRAILSYSFANHIASQFINLPIMISPLLVLEILGESSSAYVYMAWTISLFISAPGVALGSSALSESCHAPEKTRGILLRSIIYSIAVTVPLALVFSFGANLFLAIFGSTYVENASGILMVLTYAAPIVSINGIYQAYLRTKALHVELILVSFGTAVIALIGTILSISLVGIVGSGYAYLVAQAVGFLAMSIVIFNKEGKR